MRWRVRVHMRAEGEPRVSYVCEAHTAAAALQEFEHRVLPSTAVDTTMGYFVVSRAFQSEPLGVVVPSPAWQGKRGKG